MRTVKIFIFLLFILSCESEEITAEIFIRIDRSEDFCDHGGTKLNLGWDINGNNALEDYEINNVAIFCDDQFDDEVVIEWYSSDRLIQCNGDGGISVGLFFDWNKDGIRGNGENINRVIICEGFDFENSLWEVNNFDFGGVCGAGYELKIGIDLNRNQFLEESEVEQQNFLYNRLANEAQVPIEYTLSISDYQDIAQRYEDINPEAAQNLAQFNSFNLFLWTEEEIELILLEKIREHGTKVGCQVYTLTFEYYFGVLDTQVIDYRYDADLGDYFEVYL